MGSGCTTHESGLGSNADAGLERFAIDAIAALSKLKRYLHSAARRSDSNIALFATLANEAGA